MVGCNATLQHTMFIPPADVSPVSCREIDSGMTAIFTVPLSPCQPVSLPVLVSTEGVSKRYVNTYLALAISTPRCSNPILA